jgi:hypothetical protein
MPHVNEIERVAILEIEKHGDGACAVTKRHIEWLLAVGQNEAAEIWERVQHRIHTIQERPSGVSEA